MSQCPICQAEYIEGEVSYCRACGWHLEFSSEPSDRDRVAWGRQMWMQLQSYSQLNSVLQEIQVDLRQASAERSELIQQMTRISQDLMPQFSEAERVVSPARSEPEISVSYTLLEELLAKRNWQEADAESARLAIAIAQREKHGFLVESDLNKFPCRPLQDIDRLWLEATEGKFGLSVQKDLYISLGGNRFIHAKTWQEFGAKVGWYRENSWLRYDELDFTLNAPVGHLPILGDGLVWFVGGWQGGGQAFSALMSRMTKCLFNYQ